jgi:hypothetical protein
VQVVVSLHVSQLAMHPVPQALVSNKNLGEQAVQIAALLQSTQFANVEGQAVHAGDGVDT